MNSNFIAASQDAAHPQHHFSLGQVLATVMLGATDALVAASDPKNIPASVSSFVNGFLQIWMPAATQSTQSTQTAA